MKKTKIEAVPFNNRVEGDIHIPAETKRNFEILKLFHTGFSLPAKTKLKGKEKELFIAFLEEERRINIVLEIKYLQKYLLEQRNTANEMAAFIRKRNAQEIKIFGDVHFSIGCENNADYSKGAPISKFRFSHDLNDLRNKVKLLDNLLFRLRLIVDKYEALDYQREYDKKNGTFYERVLRRTLKTA